MRRLIASDIAEPSSSLTPVPGIGDLHRLIEEFQHAGVSVTLSIDDPIGELPADLGLSAYRIVQQALTNTLTHAGPSASAHVAVRSAGGELLIYITDDGPGPTTPPDPERSGRGIIGMRERAALFGGDLTAGPRAEGGFAVHARIPLGGAR